MFKRNKKGNMNALVGTGYGLILFGVIIGLGLLILNQFGANASGTANSSIQAVIGYLGNGSGGLVTWVPIVIIIVIAGIVFAMFGNKKGGY